MKVFKNEKTPNNAELPIRKGILVPDGSVNLAWTKSPDVNPKTNLLVLNSAKSEGVSQQEVSLAYADSLGILQDINGNQVWAEEFPVVTDEFLDQNNIKNISQILPYIHTSRFFHIDFAGLSYSTSMEELLYQPEVKVVDQKGRDYVDENGEKKYKVYAVHFPLEFPGNSRDALYRLLVFLDMNPADDELFLTYHKAEVDFNTNLFKDEELGYKEPINARENFRYIAEESQLIDQLSHSRKLYSTKPIDIKNQIIGRTQPAYKGWQIQVPKKAIGDPRRFQLFRWRVACEYNRKIDPTGTDRSGPGKNPINAGIVTFNTDKGHTQTRANYLFDQLNKTNYNVSGLDFRNPLQTSGDKTQAAYWHVPINDISVTDLDKFDVLVWAPSNPTVALTGSLLEKIEYFVNDLGGTFIFETSSRTQFTGVPGISFGPNLANLNMVDANVKVKLSTIDYYVDNPATPNSGFTTGQWPPKVENLWTNSEHSSTLLQKLNFLGGWDLNLDSERVASTYESFNNTALRFQTLTVSDPFSWETVIEGEKTDTGTSPVLVRKKYESGGSIYVSTGCFFEDHTVDASLSNSSSTYQITSLDLLPPDTRAAYQNSISSTNMEGEIKLRLNIFILSTAFSSANAQSTSSIGYNADSERYSATLYSDWQSSWVINAHNEVLSDEEKAKYNFALLPKVAEDPDPVWMRILSDKTVAEIMADKIRQIDPNGQNPLFNNVNGVDKRYIIIITNPYVETYSYDRILEGTVPAAWTYTYSPKFEVPVDIEPYEIREEQIQQIGVGSTKNFAIARPYKIQSSVAYVSTTSKSATANARIVLTGTGRRTYKLPDEVVYDRVTRQPAVAGYYVDKLIRWSTDSNTGFSISPRKQQATIAYSPNIEVWSDIHYGKIWGVNSWPFWGIRGTLSLNRGSSGFAVWIVQLIMNQAVYYGWIPGPFLAEDSYYGQATANKVRAFQVALGAMYIDSIVDAETWSLQGYFLQKLSEFPDIVRNNPVGTPIGNLISQASNMMPQQNISNAGNSNTYARQSWYSNGPSWIRERFMIKFDPNYSDADNGGGFDMYEIHIKPWVPNDDPAKDMIIDFLGFDMPSLYGYDFGWGSPGAISVPCRAGEYTRIPFAMRNSNSVAIGLRKDSPSGFGSSRTLGLEDVAVAVKKYVRNDPVTTLEKRTIIGKTIVEPFTMQVTYDVKLFSGIPVTFGKENIGNNFYLDNIKLTTIDGARSLTQTGYPENISEVRINSSSITSASVPTIDINSVSKIAYNGNEESGKTFTFTYNPINSGPSEPNFKAGARIGDGSTSYFVRDIDGSVERLQRTYGWVSKDDGVVLICNANGEPFGFPVDSPVQAQGSETHFSRVRMDSWDTDQNLYYGFYDVQREEFLVNINGEPDISYYDYVRRGPKNIFMAVQTDYEISTQSNLPPADQPILRPFKWAMPVYGVKLRGETSIRLRNPSSELSYNDVWPIIVSTGSFAKKLNISTEQADVSTTYLKEYGGKTLTAYYMINEGLRGPWSKLLGRPYIDTKQERPRLLSEDTLVVNNKPIAMIQEPTLAQSPADPVTPLFKVYTRIAVGQPWELVPQNDIKEYNVNTGTIVLKQPLRDIDDRLVKVDYTSRDYSYQIRFDENGKINLNPYIIRRDRPDLLDKPIYVYIKPAFVTDDSTKNVIPESKTESVVKISERNTMFGPQNEDYDPTAYFLGTIIVLSTVDITKLTILDTRVRGGGAKHHLALDGLNEEASSYWDSPATKPYAYQRGGFLIVQLPSEIIQDFPKEEDLRKAIDRNVTSGVAYELQDYDGNPLYLS